MVIAAIAMSDPEILSFDIMGLLDRCPAASKPDLSLPLNTIATRRRRRGLIYQETSMADLVALRVANAARWINAKLTRGAESNPSAAAKRR